MTEIITASVTAVISAAAFLKLSIIRESDRDDNRRVLRFFVSLAVFMVCDLAAAFTVKEGGVFRILNTSVISNFIFLLAVIDFRHRVIPNLYIAGALVLRTALILVQGLAEHALLSVFVRSAVGLAAGFIILAIVSVISGKGLGAGDVKMFAVTGYFLGLYGVIDVLIYSTFFCAVCGIILIISKKCGVKDCIPMAPFAFAGMLLYIFTGM